MLVLRVDEPAPGIAMLFVQTMGSRFALSSSFYLYGDAGTAAATRAEPLWQAWLNQHFPPEGNANTFE